MSEKSTRIAFVATVAVILGWAGHAEAARFRVCTFSFNSPQELVTIRANLPTKDFEVIDLSPPARIGPESSPVRLISFNTATSPQGSATPWLVNQCRPDLQCDIVVVSGEFAGGFFGSNGTSVRLQELEEASCHPGCQGLFHRAREVFLLGCNTLATKDQDNRTPSEYLQVLLDHGFDRPSAERVVDLRYGPLGPSFRESLRRVFMGVPRIYGFSSVAPRAEWTAPRLAKYFRAKGNYHRYIEKTAREPTENRELLTALEGSSVVQMSGLTPLEAGAVGRGVICGLYDESQPVARRLWTVRQLFAGRDFLSYLPTIEVFLNRHPPAKFRGDEKKLFREVQAQKMAREQVLNLVRDLNVSAQKMELAQLALQLEWIKKDDFRRLAVDSAKKLLAQPLSSDVVDIMCEITKHEPIGAAFSAKDLPQPLFVDAEWYRLVDCLAPVDQGVSQRLVRGLTSPDLPTRLWASYALSRRLPLDDVTLTKLTAHLDDDSPEVRARVEWIFSAQEPLSDDVRKAVHARDPQLAARL